MTPFRRRKRKLHGYQITDIRKSASNGMSLTELASKYECSIGLIQRIITHKIYADHKQDGDLDEMQMYIVGNHYYDPEMCLIEAMLLLAREDIVSRSKTEHSDNAINWIIGEDDDGGYSFTNITEYLGLNTGKARQAILSKASTNQLRRAKKRHQLDIEMDDAKGFENMQPDVQLGGQ